MLQPPMLTTHIQAFLAAAKLYNVYILVRRTNLMSLQFIGKPGFTPKRLDCKAKTADASYFHPLHGVIDCGGLVVDPTITGKQAFGTQKKYDSALKEWKKFSSELLDPLVATWESQQALTYVPNGRFYFVDLKPGSQRFGCVKFTSSSLMTAGKYIHGDFDLYGIVTAANPQVNVAVVEKRLGQTHARSQEFFDVQHFVNRQIGVPMILHGAQESYSPEHSDEGIDIFQPDGKVTSAEDLGEITALYETTFRGRKLFTREGPRDIVLGMFMTPG